MLDGTTYHLYKERIVVFNDGQTKLIVQSYDIVNVDYSVLCVYACVCVHISIIR